MTGRVGRLAARLDEVEATVIELLARVQTLELVVRPPTRLGKASAPLDNGGDDRGRGGAS